MICNKCGKFIAIAVLIITLCHRTTGGSWKNLERKFIQDSHRSEQWDENRVIFPDTEEDSSEEESTKRWRPTVRPRDEDAKQRCLNSCPTSREYSPVCGTNGMTYQNMKHLQCAMSCGYAVDLHRPFPCVTEATNRPSVTTTAKNVDDDWCMKSCPTTPEYNPVCGTNQVTYNNIGKLECAKYCGVAVELLRRMPCSSQLVRTTTNAPSSPSVPDEDTQYCINTCPVTSQYDPVCGTDNVTYKNIGKLECAKACGVRVVLKHQWPCKTSADTLAPQTSEEDYDGGIDPRFTGRESRLHFT